MPKYNPGEDDMDPMYGSTEPVRAPEDMGGEEPESVDQENAEEGQQTAIVSNKILSPEGEPLKEGDEIVVKIVKNYGDESEIAYAPKEGAESDEAQTSDKMGADTESEIAALDTEG